MCYHLVWRSDSWHHSMFQVRATRARSHLDLLTNLEDVHKALQLHSNLELSASIKANHLFIPVRPSQVTPLCVLPSPLCFYVPNCLWTTRTMPAQQFVGLALKILVYMYGLIHVCYILFQGVTRVSRLYSLKGRGVLTKQESMVVNCLAVSLYFDNHTGVFIPIVCAIDTSIIPQNNTGFPRCHNIRIVPSGRLDCWLLLLLRDTSSILLDILLHFNGLTGVIMMHAACMTCLLTLPGIYWHGL